LYKYPRQLLSSACGFNGFKLDLPIMAISNEYGALGNSTSNNISSAHGNDEEQPLLWRPASISGWRKKMVVDIHRHWADIVLLMCYIITGLLDSASISTWGSFVSMQTGLLDIASLYISISESKLTESFTRKYCLHWARFGRPE